jgi:hypothetical protein
VSENAVKAHLKHGDVINPDFASDAANCGTCGHVCPGVGSCVDGVCNCVESVTTAFGPGDGPQLPPTLYLDASESSSACGSPLAYHWSCQGTDSLNCNAFLAATAGGNVVTYEFPLYQGEIFNIGLQVCTRDGSVCGTLLVRSFDGV